MPSSSRLFKPLCIGNFKVSNRLVLAPLSWYCADDLYTLLLFVTDYYAQRASYPGTLLVTKATFIAPRASSYTNVPGIYNSAHSKASRELEAAFYNGCIYHQSIQTLMQQPRMTLNKSRAMSHSKLPPETIATGANSHKYTAVEKLGRAEFLPHDNNHVTTEVTSISISGDPVILKRLQCC
jgi:2,4-dienoyl-CoA reductase-like NADH-dependent reductase (Old Yellow Enzyme family)